MIYSGDTVRLKVHFRALTGQSIDPTDVALTIYDTNQEQIEQFSLNDTNREDTGVFFMDYVVPNDKQEVVFEFRGTHNANPVLVRDSIQIKFN